MKDEAQKSISAGRIRSVLSHSALVPVLGVFMDVQLEASRAGLENPEKYKLDCLNDYNNEKKFYDNFSKVLIGDSRVKDISASADTIRHERAGLLANITAEGDDFAVSVRFNCEETADVFIKKPRGVNTTLYGVQLGSTAFEVQNVYNIYWGESFTLAARFSDVWIAISPYSGEGLKGSGSVAVWFYSPETGILKDDGAKYFDCAPILNLFKG